MMEKEKAKLDSTLWQTKERDVAVVVVERTKQV
jgi:hypothetical protein